MGLNCDEINRFGVETDPGKVDTWHDVYHSLNLRIKLEQKGQKKEKDLIFLVFS